MKSFRFNFSKILPRALVTASLTLAGGAIFPVRADVPAPVELKSGWQMQDSAKVAEQGADLAQVDFPANGWYTATVPGTVLTTLVANGAYPEPLYGENNRPDKIPESLCRTSYWYRTVVHVPNDYTGKKIWLNFEGINYAAEVWVNGKDQGAIKGAFSRGIFDISAVANAGKDAALAVLVSPQPHPGKSHEHTAEMGMGPNGGLTAIDGATFLCAIGWDWIPAIRDRDTGIWQKVFLSATGPVVIKDPQVTTNLSLPSLDSADITVAATLQNASDQPQKGILHGSFGDVVFQQEVELSPESSKQVALDPKIVPALHLSHPKLWWPNGYGPQNLYALHLHFTIGESVSDEHETNFGIRQITYSVPESDNLTLSVNGVRLVCKGGDWGMDEAMKRIPRERLEAEIRMHQIANYTIIRNWVGQSTSEDFYDMCDKYGILLWDEFFQPNPGDGPNPTDLDTYIANVREKVLRFRNHPSVAVWCARNEGYPPKDIEDRLRPILAELDPNRHYQASSTAGKGVHSSGPYLWRTPREYYVFPDSEAFKTEIGSVSIPTLESIQGMMPQKDWEQINDDWAEHDLTGGASGGNNYPKKMADRYGQLANLADFVRKGQLMNYEAFRAMYEGRDAKMFNPVTGVITWMSNPAQPSFVWQLYHHDLEPNSSLFAVRKACEPVHIQMNEKEERVEVINNLPTLLEKARAHLSIYNLDGSIVSKHDYDVSAPASKATVLGKIEWPNGLSPVYFIKLELIDAGQKLVSENLYWRGLPERVDDLQELDKLPSVTLDAKVVRHDADGKCLLDVTLKNPGPQVAVMAHLQLRREKSNERVLPVYYTDNYISLVPGQSETIAVEAAQADLKGEKPLLVMDGWNIKVTPFSSPDAAVALNTKAQVDQWPVTNMPIVTNTWISTSPRADHIRIACGSMVDVGTFEADEDFSGGHGGHDKAVKIDRSVPRAGPEDIYKSERWGKCSYIFSMKSAAPGHAYTVRLHFAETTFNAAGKRKFDVEINGAKVLSDFDPFQEAGGRDKPVLKEFSGIVPDASNNIVIKLKKGSADEAQINAIEIEPGA